MLQYSANRFSCKRKVHIAMETLKCDLKNARVNMDVFDLTKFVMSFMVVAIHSNLCPSVLYPWLRMAVPMFFIISGYILFTRLNHIAEEEQADCVMHYIHRNMKLYMIWFVILLPVTVITRRSWFDDGTIRGIYRCIRAFLFGSTFRTSWYLTASVTSVLLVYTVSKKMRIHYILAASAIC